MSFLQAQEVIEIGVDQYIKTVRENHPTLKIEEMNPQIKKTIMEETPIVSGFGGIFTTDYQQNHNDSPLKSESKSLSYGWNYNLLESGTRFGVNIDNTQSELNNEDIWNTTATLSIYQPLLFNGLLRNQINNFDIKRYDYEISQVSFQMAKSQIILQSLILYRQYEITKEVNVLSKELLRSAEEILEFNRRRSRIGTVSRSDILNSESQIIKNQMDIQNSDASLQQLQENLLYSMGHPEPDNSNVNLRLISEKEIPLNPAEYQKSWNVAFKERNEFQLYSLQIAAADNALSMGKKVLFPELDVYINYSFLGRDGSLGGSYENAFRGFSLNNTDIIWGVKFRLPTEIAKYRLATKRPSQNKELSQRSLSDFHLKLKNDIRAKVRNYNNAYDIYKKNQTVVDLTRERYNIAREEYFIGKLDYTRLLQVEQELKQSTIGYLNSKFNYYKAELELESAQGTLLEKYGVQ